MASVSLAFWELFPFLSFVILVYEEIKSVFFSVSAVLQEVVFREESEKNGLGVAPRSCFGVQGGCFLSSLSEGSPRLRPFHPAEAETSVFSEEQNAHADSCICRALWFNGAGHIGPLVAGKLKSTSHTVFLEELVTA